MPVLQTPLLLLFCSFLFVIEHMMPLCMVISWVYSVAMMIQHIVAEKEQRLKEVSRLGSSAGPGVTLLLGLLVPSGKCCSGEPGPPEPVRWVIVCAGLVETLTR